LDKGVGETGLNKGGLTVSILVRYVLMKKAFILIIACSISALNTYAEKITIDSKGNIYLLGLVQDSITFSDSTTIYTNSFPYESPKTYLVKLDPVGSVIWYKLFDQDDENYFDIKVDHADHLVLASLLAGNIALDSITIIEYISGFLIAKFDPEEALIIGLADEGPKKLK